MTRLSYDDTISFFRFDGYPLLLEGGLTGTSYTYKKNEANKVAVLDFNASFGGSIAGRELDGAHPCCEGSIWV